MINIAKLQFNPFGENTYVLYNESKHAIIVDCGTYNESEEQTLAAFLEKNGLQPIMVASTHGHIDHICGALRACERYSVPFALSVADKDILEANSEFASSMGFNIPAVPVIAIDLASEESLKLGDDIIEIIKTPGHTPGGVCFHIPSQKQLIAGDTLFAGSIGRTDLPGGDYKQLMTSIVKKLMTLDGATTVFPGHGGQTTIGSEALYNPFVTEVMQGEVNY